MPLGTLSAMVLYQLPIKTSGEDSCIATNEAIRNFCGGYYRVDDINYLCHVRYSYGMFPCNKSLALGHPGLVIYCGNIPNGRDTYYSLDIISQLAFSGERQLLTFVEGYSTSHYGVCYHTFLHR